MPTALDQLLACVPGSTSALMQWVLAQLAVGHPPNALQKSLVEAGWPPPLAQAAVQACQSSACTAPAAPPLAPEPDLANHPSDIDVGDRRVQVLCTWQHPRLVLFGNLLSDTECEQLIADARPVMERSQTVNSQASAANDPSDRTSDGMFFQRAQTPVVARLEARIARLVRWPTSHGEGLQVLRYRPGAQYKPHHDYFAPEAPQSAALLQHGGQRVGTLVIYLNDVPAGGCTYFPQSQLRIHPRKGHAVFFSYAVPSASTLTLHGGDPVLTGEKWIATKWLREREFR